jgi:hypothetical protein
MTDDMVSMAYSKIVPQAAAAENHIKYSVRIFSLWVHNTNYPNLVKCTSSERDPVYITASLSS